MPCIRCGDCAEVCPELLLPQQLLWFAKSGDAEQSREHRLFDCIECGCCAYVCPSRIPLVHYYRQAKAQLVVEDARDRDAAAARQRFNRKTDRLRIEADTKRNKTRAADPEQDTKAEKKAYVQKALARTRAKRRQQPVQDGDAG